METTATDQALEAATDAAIAAEQSRMPGAILDRPAVMRMIEAARPYLGGQAAALGLNLIAPDDDATSTETLNEIAANIPECWGDDVAIDDIVIRYVRHLEAEVARLGGSTCNPKSSGGDPHRHGPGGEMVFDADLRHPHHPLLREDGTDGS